MYRAMVEREDGFPIIETTLDDDRKIEVLEFAIEGMAGEPMEILLFHELGTENWYRLDELREHMDTETYKYIRATMDELSDLNHYHARGWVE